MLVTFHLDLTRNGLQLPCTRLTAAANGAGTVLAGGATSNLAAASGTAAKTTTAASNANVNEAYFVTSPEVHSLPLPSAPHSVVPSVGGGSRSHSGEERHVLVLDGGVYEIADVEDMMEPVTTPPPISLGSSGKEMSFQVLSHRSTKSQ